MTAVVSHLGGASPLARFGPLWHRQLAHYPSTTRRYLYLGITVVAAIVLYYELYVQGTVATQVIHEYGMSFKYFVAVSIVGNAVGALASIGAGLADRFGRANMVVYGLGLTGLLTAFALPNAGSKGSYMFLFALLCVVEGVVLVATPALVRDFSPQLGRASAMGFWTLGPVLGSLSATGMGSKTLDMHPDWQYQFHVSGAIGLVVFVLALLFLKELSPALRDQLMVSHRERALVEARADGVEPSAAIAGRWGQMLRLDIVGPAFAIACFLIFYYVIVGFFVVYMATVYGYSGSKANALANWFWVTNAVVLVVTGVLSDRLHVRKPFMIVGAVVSMVGMAMFAMKATEPSTSYYSLAVLMVVMSTGIGMAYCAWMAAFTETVEKHNPAATATGLAVWGGLLRTVVTVVLFALTLVVSSTNVLVDSGSKVQVLASQYHSELATAAAINPVTLAKLSANPQDATVQLAAVADLVRHSGVTVKVASAQLVALSKVPPADLAYLKSTGPKVEAAKGDVAGQWQQWWWISFGGQLLFVPFIFLMVGRWSPKKAMAEAKEHEVLVNQQLAALAH